MIKQRGFTLIEVILVLVIVSIIIVLGMNYMQQKTQATRIERTSLQIQQILNAGLAFYVLNGRWPTGLAELQPNFLPAGAITNSWGQTYTVVPGPAIPSASGPLPPALLYVYTSVTGSAATGSAFASAAIIAGKLPLGYTTLTNPSGAVPDRNTPCTTATTICFVTGSVNIPGQNLNNASAVNFAGVYHHGACIPVPNCPVDSGGRTMTPQVFLVPIQVSGLSENRTDDPNNRNIYPLSSFTAYAAYTNAAQPAQPALSPPRCNNTTGTPPPCSNATPQAGDRFWRACMDVVTERGSLGGLDSNWGNKVSMAAFTRCQINAEPAGSAFTIFSN